MILDSFVRSHSDFTIIFNYLGLYLRGTKNKIAWCDLINGEWYPNVFERKGGFSMNSTVNKTLLIYFNFSLALSLMAMMICNPDSSLHSVFVSTAVHLWFFNRSLIFTEYSKCVGLLMAWFPYTDWKYYICTDPSLFENLAWLGL